MGCTLAGALSISCAKVRLYAGCLLRAFDKYNLFLKMYPNLNEWINEDEEKNIFKTKNSFKEIDLIKNIKEKIEFNDQYTSPFECNQCGFNGKNILTKEQQKYINFICQNVI